MNKVKVKSETITKIFKVMCKNSSRKTGKVSLNIKGIAEKTKLSTRTVDRALAQMRASNQIKTLEVGINYVK